MRAGKMRNQGRIQASTPTRDAIGGEVAAWADIAGGDAWWFELAEVKGGEVFRGRVVSAQATGVAVGRYVAGVTARHRLVLGARVFDIVHVNNVEQRGVELRLDLKERGV